MTQYIYMNERVRDPKTKGPVIVVQDDIHSSCNVRESNEFEIRFHGQSIGRVKFDPKGLAACATHEVRAWVEFDDDVEVVNVAKAAPKIAGKKVKT
jgi:hypothetical protein